MTISKLPEDVMPDQVTCLHVPRDQHGELMQAGRQYRIDGIRFACFEDMGSLFIQRCYPIGTLVPGSAPQCIDDLRADVKPFRLLD